MDAGSIPAASTIPSLAARRGRALYCGRGPVRPTSCSAAASGASTPPASRWPRVLDPLPVSIAARARLHGSAASSSCSRAARSPAGYRDDGPLLITLTVASALSLALLWWSPFAGLCVSLVSPVRAVDHAATSSPQAAVWAVVVASFATVAFDRRRRALVGRLPGRRPAGRPWSLTVAEPLVAESAGRVGLALGRLGGRRGDPRLYRGSIERAERRADALRRRPRGPCPRGGRGGALAPRARAARQRWARAQRGRAARRRGSARHRHQAGAGARGARLASRPPAARRSRTSSACSASFARPTTSRRARRRPGSGAARQTLCEQVREAGCRSP